MGTQTAAQESGTSATENVSARSVIAERLQLAAYGITDQALAVGGMFLANIALARVNSKEEYGAFALCYSFYTFLSGLHNAIIVEPYTVFGSGRYHKSFQAYARFMRGKNTLACAAVSGVLFIAWLIMRWVVPGPAIPSLLGMALACGILLTGTFIRRGFYVERRPDRAAVFSALFFATLVVLLAGTIRFHWLAGRTTFIISALAWSFAAILMIKVLPGHSTGKFQESQNGYWSEHWKYSGWVLATAFVFQLMTQGYYWLVAGFLSVKEVAGLRAIHLLVLPVDQLFAAFTLLILPVMAHRYATRQHSALISLWVKYSLLFLVVTSLFGTAVCFLSLPLLHIIYAGKYDDLSQLLALLAFVPLVMGVGTASNVALKAAERPKAVFFAYVASGTVTFLAGMPLVIYRGLPGAVYGMLLSAAAYTVTLFVLWISFVRNGAREKAAIAVRIAIIEPVWTSYRYRVYHEIAQHAQVDWLFSPADSNDGFGKPSPAETPALRYYELPMAKPFGANLGFWQRGLVSYLCFERPDVVMTSSEPRALSFWCTLLAGRLLKIPVYAHGHGVFKKKQISWAYRRMINCLLSLSSGYIAYSSFVRDAFVKNGFKVDKVSVAENSLINLCPVLPEEKTGNEKGILFLGRLRPGCGVELLLDVVKWLREHEHPDLQLHIIGDGNRKPQLQKQSIGSLWVHWHGEIHNPAKIREISKVCFIGCHPGNAGLSVVHLMSLSLPVVVHSELESHQGPEPGYIKDAVNGFLFDRTRAREGLYRALHIAATNFEGCSTMRRAAFREYTALTSPSLASRILAILRDRTNNSAVLSPDKTSEIYPLPS